MQLLGVPMLLLIASLLGCSESGGSGVSPAVSPGPPEEVVAAAFASSREVLEADATDPMIQARLEATGLSSDLDSRLRLLALRRLEEVRAERLVAVAEALTRSPERQLAANAVGVLVRSDADMAREALARLEGEQRDLAERLQAQRERGN
jgi:hypothetical protein